MSPLSPFPAKHSAKSHCLPFRTLHIQVFTDAELYIELQLHCCSEKINELHSVVSLTMNLPVMRHGVKLTINYHWSTLATTWHLSRASYSSVRKSLFIDNDEWLTSTWRHFIGVACAWFCWLNGPLRSPPRPFSSVSLLSPLIPSPIISPCISLPHLSQSPSDLWAA